MPDPLSIIRLAALLVFIGLVAVGLWLLDVAWWVVPPVMALALVIAWTIEWLAWRGMLTTAAVQETTTAAPAPVAPAAEKPPLPIEAIVPAPPPEPVPKPEPERPTIIQESPAPEPKPAPAPEPAAPEPSAEPQPLAEPPPAASVEPEKRARRPRRMRLRPVPAPASRRPVEPPVQPQPAESPVVAFRPRTATPRSWNLWDLERIAREGVRAQPERRDEWAYLFLHLRQFAAADGSLPAEFDGLVRESFGGLLERAPGA